MNNNYGLMATETGEMLSLRGVEVTARVTGTLVATSLVQKYQNDTEANFELSYTFPLPVSGTLLSFSVMAGEHKYEGEVIPRVEAEVQYEKTIDDGNSAFRLQEVRPGMYNVALGNVLPGESVTINLSYAEPLAWNGKCLRYRLPTTIAPRYGAPSGMQPWQRPETSLAPEYPLNLTLTIAGPLAHSSISCASHKVKMKLAADELTVLLAEGATMDRDFILEIENEDVRSLGSFANARETNIALLTLLPPEVKSRANDRDVVLVLDCSGSMQGDSLALAKEGLFLALGSLTPSEHFGIVAFGSRFLMFDKAMQRASLKNLDMARRWVDFLEDLGGTDIDGALEIALKLKRGRPMDILLLTDGQDWEAGKAIQHAKSLSVRIFSMGIGSAVSEESVRLMANETGGACELVAPTEDMSERIFRHFNRIRQPKMTRLDIEWPTKPVWESRPVNACFAGDAYTIYAALPKTAEGSIQVSYSFEDDASQSAEVPLTVEMASADAIVRLGARERMAALSEEAQQDWAVAYQLISSKTDYLITVQRMADEKATDFPQFQNQPQMLPAGWSGTSSVVKRAQFSRSLRRAPVSSSAQVFACHGSIAYGSGGIDYSQLDVPAVLKCRSLSRSITEEAFQEPNGYNRFLEKLNARSKRKVFNGLPKEIKKLRGISLPNLLEKLIDQLLAEGVKAGVVLHSFYSALLNHSGRTLISLELEEKLRAFIDEALVVSDVEERIQEVLVGLWDNRMNGVDRFDIPAFLRKQAD